MAKRRQRQRTGPKPRKPTTVHEAPLREVVPREPQAAPLPWWSILLLLGLILATYAPTLRAGFVWDDVDHVVDNERVTAPDGLRRSWSETKSPGYYPVTYTTFFVEWRLSHGQPWLFHLDNVLLHAASALLVARLGGEIGLGGVARWTVAAVWAVHPMQATSVGWIAERKNVLYVLLYLVSLQLYIGSTQPRSSPRARAARYAASVVLFPLALLSKAAGITLPAAMTLVQWVRGRPLDRRFWGSLVPYVLVAVAGAAALLSSVPAELPAPPLGVRLVHAARALWFYLATFVYPGNLLTMYPQWPPTVGVRDVAIWLGLVSLLGFIVAGRTRIPRIVTFGLSFFVLNGLPVVGVVWFTYLDSAPVADHLSYLPNLGLAFAIVGGAAFLARLSDVRAYALLVASALWTISLAALCWHHTGVLQNEEVFWRSALAGNPDCFVCHYNLGKLFENQGDRDAAAREYETTLRIKPDHDAAVSLGNIRLLEGRVDEAADLYRRAAKLDRTSEKPHKNLALLAASAGRTEEAITEYGIAVRLAPDDDGAINSLADVLATAGRGGDAIAVLAAGLHRLPESDLLANSLAWLRATSSDPQLRDGREAVRLAERACERTRHRDPDDLDTLAAAYAAVGRFTDAVATARLALQVAEPDGDLAEQLRARLQLYEAGEPFVQQQATVRR